MLLVGNLDNHEHARMGDITRRIFPDTYSQRPLKSKIILFAFAEFNAVCGLSHQKVLEPHQTEI